MVYSGNDGAIAIADIDGHGSRLVNLMNEAAALWLHGHALHQFSYHDDYHLSTARDLAIIAREAMQIWSFARWRRWSVIRC